MQTAEQIKSRVKMRDVLQAYGLPYQRRMKCPIHNGNDNNFEVKEESFMCYSYCGGGDVITFVQLMNSCDFRGACEWLDRTFTLGLYEKPSLTQYRASQRAAEQRQREREDLERKKEHSRKSYNLLCQYFRWLNKQDKTAQIEFDIVYVQKLLDRYIDQNELIEWDAKARIEALISKHGKGLEDINGY
jgi:phage/plasmid primase-like uncharacterized protein